METPALVWNASIRGDLDRYICREVAQLQRRGQLADSSLSFRPQALSAELQTHGVYLRAFSRLLAPSIADLPRGCDAHGVLDGVLGLLASVVSVRSVDLSSLFTLNGSTGFVRKRGRCPGSLSPSRDKSRCAVSVALSVIFSPRRSGSRTELAANCRPRQPFTGKSGEGSCNG